jgi:hypothetical protein
MASAASRKSAPSRKKSQTLKNAPAKRDAPGKARAKSIMSARSTVAPAVAAEATPKIDEAKAERVTKQERVLRLLSRSEGASIEEIMQATDWRQHSVRGFLAGTVKRKLGCPLTSSKTNGDARRYRIENRRGR